MLICERTYFSPQLNIDWAYLYRKMTQVNETTMKTWTSWKITLLKTNRSGNKHLGKGEKPTVLSQTSVFNFFASFPRNSLVFVLAAGAYIIRMEISEFILFSIEKMTRCVGYLRCLLWDVFVCRQEDMMKHSLAKRGWVKQKDHTPIILLPPLQNSYLKWQNCVRKMTKSSTNKCIFRISRFLESKQMWF